MGGVFRRQDVLGGLLLAAWGVLGLVFGRSLDLGTARRMGPGFFPTVLSWLLILLGIGIAAVGALRSGALASGVRWRPLILVTVAVVVFSALIDRAGLVAATAAVVSVAALAGRDARWLEVMTLAVAMAPILVNLPGETSSIVTCLDGHQMAKNGRAGAALAVAALGSFSSR